MAGKRNMNPKSLENLKKGKKFKSGDEATKEAGANGGIQQGENGRRRKSMAELARKIADAPAPEKAKTQLAKLGFEDEEMNGNAMVVADAIQIRPVYIAPFLAIPILVILILYILISTSVKNKTKINLKEEYMKEAGLQEAVLETEGKEDIIEAIKVLITRESNDK